MGLINLLLKLSILTLNLRDVYGALDTKKLADLGQAHKSVPSVIKKPQQGTDEVNVSRDIHQRRRLGTPERRANVRGALVSLLIWNLFVLLEPTCDRILSWFIPFYDSCKSLLLLWMLFTRTYGATLIFSRFIVPTVKPYEKVLDLIALSLAGLTRIGLETFQHGFWRLLSLGRLVFGDKRHVAVKVKDDAGTPPSQNPEPTSFPANGRHDSAKKKPGVRKPLRGSGPSSAKWSSIESRVADPTSRTMHISSLPMKQETIPSAKQVPIEQHTIRKPAFHARPEEVRSADRRASDAAPQELGRPPSPPVALRNFAHIPQALAFTSAEPLLSPPPKLPGAFNFAFIPPAMSSAPRFSAPVATPSVSASSERGARSPSKKRREPSPGTIIPVLQADLGEVRSGEALEDDLIVAPPPRKMRSISGARSKATQSLRTTSSMQSLRVPPSNPSGSGASVLAWRPRPEVQRAMEALQSRPPANSAAAGKARMGTTRAGVAEKAGKKRSLEEEAKGEGEEVQRQRTRSSPRKKKRIATGSESATAAKTALAAKSNVTKAPAIRAKAIIKPSKVSSDTNVRVTRAKARDKQ